MGFGAPKVGTQSTVSAATVTPAWNTATTAGSLGLGFVLANTANGVSGPAGWINITVNNTSQFTLWYKLKLAASEANPTFTSTSATVMKAYMVEVPVSGVGTVIRDQQGSGTSTTSPVTASNPIKDGLPNDIVVCGSAWRNNTSVTGTISYTAGYTNLLNDGASSSTAHIAGCFQIFTAGGVSADSVATSFTGSVKNAASAIASFQLAQLTAITCQTLQAVNRASVF